MGTGQSVNGAQTLETRGACCVRSHYRQTAPTMPSLSRAMWPSTVALRPRPREVLQGAMRRAWISYAEAPGILNTGSVRYAAGETILVRKAAK